MVLSSVVFLFGGFEEIAFFCKERLESAINLPLVETAGQVDDWAISGRMYVGTTQELLLHYVTNL